METTVPQLKKVWPSPFSIHNTKEIGGSDNQSSSAETPKNTVNDNRANNTRNSASELVVQGQIRLLGVPLLKAELGITVLNVGSAASGKWYVKTVEQEWDVATGYITVAHLLRSQLPLGKKSEGSGVLSGPDGQQVPVKTGTPVKLSADIYKRGKASLKTRNLDAPSQMTVTYGAEPYQVINFTCSISQQENKSKDKTSKGYAFYKDNLAGPDGGKVSISPATGGVMDNVG